MKVERLKAFRRILNFFKMKFNMLTPFKILVDEEFLHQGLQKKVHLKEMIPKALSEKAFMTATNCVVANLSGLGEDYSAARLMAKRMERIECNHENALSSAECFKDFLSRGANMFFIVAVQDAEGRKQMRLVPGLPIIYLNNNMVTLETPSKASREVAIKNDQQKLLPKDLLRLQKQKEQERKEAQEKKEQLLKVKKPKGPNPLSVQKKKRKPEDNQRTEKRQKLDSGESHEHDTVTEEEGQQDEHETQHHTETEPNLEQEEQEDQQTNDGEVEEVAGGLKKKRRKRKHKKKTHNNINNNEAMNQEEEGEETEA